MAEGMTREELKALIENGLITGAYSPVHTEQILAKFDGLREEVKVAQQDLEEHFNLLESYREEAKVANWKVVELEQENKRLHKELFVEKQHVEQWRDTARIAGIINTDLQAKAEALKRICEPVVRFREDKYDWDIHSLENALCKRICDYLDSEPMAEGYKAMAEENLEIVQQKPICRKCNDKGIIYAACAESPYRRKIDCPLCTKQPTAEERLREIIDDTIGKGIMHISREVMIADILKWHEEFK